MIGKSGGNENESSTALEKVLDYFIHQQNNLLTRLQDDKANENVKRDMLRLAEEQFILQGVKKDELSKCVQEFEKYIWGYYVLDDLISDKTISDVKCYSYDHIRVKRLGKRETVPVAFKNMADYRRFVSMVAVKNQVNISTLNAIQSFTDEESSPDFILRCDICTEYINAHKSPVLQIRKHPRYKYTTEQLLAKDVLTKEQADYILKKVASASGILVVGKGGAGKTTIMNWMLERIPKDKSGIVIQDHQELFPENHPDILVQRIRQYNGENRVRYGLKELATNALLMDVDYFILSEIKGPEAADFTKASYTGHQCWASVHGKNEYEGIYKLADYVKQATSYELDECLRMLTGMEVVIFMKDFQVAGISEIKGFNEKERRLEIVGVELPKPCARSQEG